MRTCTRWSALLLVVAAGAARAGAEDRRLVLEGPAEIDPVYCGPCMTTWVTGVRPGDKIAFAVQDAGIPDGPQSVPGECNEVGLGWGTYHPVGETQVTGYVNGEATDPGHCSPPIHPVGDCPPPPMATALHAPREGPIRVPLSRKLPVATVRLDFLRLDPTPRWEPLPLQPQINGEASPLATFDVHGLDAGIYRTQASDAEGNVLEVWLIRVD